ncbi:hypothetical protein K0B96_14995 [Horticoccus luteus]|uniref:Uncharacterized protein n=1 Tax=Horticoccus luteus TaxID=2862869 RepID=A0A8F9TVL3_9BACT|nr:hypothetical protein [Horticoccus luteus]QYM78589.1 hypothetical protein K0B96_14995 [Horticoccus luteus]
MSTTLAPHATAAEWNRVRAAFATSLLVDTSLTSLALNLDGPGWPINDPAETPSAYLDLTSDEVIAALARQGQPPERFDQLVAILRDTLAFDEPFSEMVAQSETAAAQENPVVRNLAKLQIPETFPLALAALTPDTLEFCRRENVATLGEFALLAQRFSQKITLAGDFRALLNALSHIDEPTLARYLPFRPGAKGLHLIEAVALAVRALPPAERAILVASPAAASPSLRARVRQLAVYFAVECTDLAAMIAHGVPLSRLVMVLNAPGFESTVAALLDPHLPAGPHGSPTVKRNWFSRFFR